MTYGKRSQRSHCQAPELSSGSSFLKAKWMKKMEAVADCLNHTEIDKSRIADYCQNQEQVPAVEEYKKRKVKLEDGLSPDRNIKRQKKQVSKKRHAVGLPDCSNFRVEAKKNKFANFNLEEAANASSGLDSERTGDSERINIPEHLTQVSRRRKCANSDAEGGQNAKKLCTESKRKSNRASDKRKASNPKSRSPKRRLEEDNPKGSKRMRAHPCCKIEGQSSKQKNNGKGKSVAVCSDAKNQSDCIGKTASSKASHKRLQDVIVEDMKPAKRLHTGDEDLDEDRYADDEMEEAVYVDGNRKRARSKSNHENLAHKRQRSCLQRLVDMHIPDFSLDEDMDICAPSYESGGSDSLLLPQARKMDECGIQIQHPMLRGLTPHLPSSMLHRAQLLPSLQHIYPARGAVSRGRRTTASGVETLRGMMPSNMIQQRNILGKSSSRTSNGKFPQFFSRLGFGRWQMFPFWK